MSEVFTHEFGGHTDQLSDAPWSWSALELASAIRAKRISVTEAVGSVLDRIDATNPRNNALTDVMHGAALTEALLADQAIARNSEVGPLHGVPVLIKVNIDTAGYATTDGVVAARHLMATEDAPLVQSLRKAGAIVVGRSNTPAFSMRWFTDNDLHGRTLNPFNPNVTPGGSSGGAAAAVALGMAPIAHGNDYGGSIRYPAWACGVVGLRTTAGRIPSYCATAPNRNLTLQQMSVQGPLTRTVADARLALRVMSQGSSKDPQWVPAPLEYPQEQRPLRIALFKSHPAYLAAPSVAEALAKAAEILAQAGCVIEEVAPPDFEQAADLWRQMVMQDARREVAPAIAQQGDRAVRNALHGFLNGLKPMSCDHFLDAQVQRFNIARAWAEFLTNFDVLMLPNSWEAQFAVDEDQKGDARVEQMLRAQSPLLATAMLGLPGLSVPTGMTKGLPTGVQLVAGKFREDKLLTVGALIEAACKFDVLKALPAFP